MGTVTQFAPATPTVTLRQAVDGYLRTLSHPETLGTWRVYAGVLHALSARFGGTEDLAGVTPDALGEWFTGQWGQASPSRWNTALAAVRSAARYWQRQGWITADPSAALCRRQPREDRSRAMSRADVERLLTRDDIPLRERTLWRMLYETAARSAEVLRLNVQDLDLANRRAVVRRKGGATDVIVWQTGTARLLPRLLKGRTEGPVFLTERRSRVTLAPADTEPGTGRARLSYEQARDLFRAASGGATLHQLRHSALTHDAEDGTGASMLMARSGHTSIRSLARYARVSAEALQRHQEQRDPARRR